MGTGKYPVVTGETDGVLTFEACACGADAMTDRDGVPLCGACYVAGLLADTPPSELPLMADEGGPAGHFVTAQHWSVTTSSHINAWTRGKVAGTIQQDVLDGLILMSLTAEGTTALKAAIAAAR